MMYSALYQLCKPVLFFIPTRLTKQMLNNEHKPEEPSQEDCCQSGCNPCVFDIYTAQLKLWELNKKTKTVARYDLLSQTRFKPFILRSISPLTADTNLYTFQPAVEGNSDISGILPYNAGQHLILRSNNHNEKSKIVSRAYTIVSYKNDQDDCTFQVLIKVYKEGVMSRYVQSLLQGDTVYWRGPYGDFTYEPNKYRNMLMICIGTGIAPMYAIIQEIVNNEDDETMVMLMYGCRSPSDIILRENLYKFGSYWNFSYSCYLSQSYSERDKKYSEKFTEGRISEEHIKCCLRFPVESLQVLVCGNNNFTSEVLDILLHCDVPKTNIHTF